MADDDGPYVTLEDQTVDAPEPEPPPPEPPPEPEPEPAQQPVAAQPPDQEDEDDDPEAKAVPDRLTNERMVPLPEVLKWREKAKARKGELETLSGKVADLEAQAARAKELEAAVQQWQAYAQQFASKGPAVAPVADPQDAQRQQQFEQARRVRAERIAKRFDLYKADGTLDVERGLEHLSEQEELAREQAAQMVQPLRQETAQSKSQANRAALAAHLQRQGTPVDATLFNQLWAHLTPELTANQEVAAVAAAAALGWPLLFGKQAPAQVQQAVAEAAQPPKPSPVVPTEPVQQRIVGAPRLTGSAAKAARELGLTAEQVEKRYGGTASPWTVLADDVEGNR